MQECIHRMPHQSNTFVWRRTGDVLMLPISYMCIAEITHLTSTKDNLYVNWSIVYPEADKQNTIKMTYPNRKTELFPLFSALNLDFEWAHNEVTIEDLFGKTAILITIEGDIRAISTEKTRPLNYKKFNTEVSA